MWNSFQTNSHQGLLSGITSFTGANGDLIHAYVARPEGEGPFPGVVAVHHLPGWDEFYQEFSRRLASHGYTVICPDLYCRFGHATPDDVAARVRAEGGVSDASVIGDCEAAMKWLKALPSASGKVGILGTCSGGRHSVLVASRVPGFDAVIDMWGGGVVMARDALTEKRPVAPIDYTKDLNTPLLGLFGNDDQAPTAEQVNQHEEALKLHNKKYEFHRYDGAGHGFIYYQTPLYRQQQAMDAWSKIFTFFQQNLQG